MRRIVALDIGSVRIGVAVSDPLGMFAQGAAVLNARGDWLAELADIVAQYGDPVILIGMPRRTDGSEGPEAQRMRTTTIAQQALLEADVSRSGRKKKVDKIAATLLLQSYLDSGRNI